MKASFLLRRWLLQLSLLAALSITFDEALAFVIPQSQTTHPFGLPHTRRTESTRTSSLTCLFLFDFFRQRSQEGFDQLSNIAESAKRGELGKGLTTAAAYAANTNTAFADGLAKSRNQLLQNLEAIFRGVSENDLLEELEDVLLQADLGAATAQDIIEEVRSLRAASRETAEGGWMLSRDDLRSILRGKLIESLDNSERKTRAVRFAPPESNFPTVLFIMGANGMGKTTTIGKLAHRLRTEGNQTVLMAACDTFRAGAVEQLQQWADRAECDMVGPDEQQAKTPSAVLYKALDQALGKDGAKKYDTVLVDTSGRLSNNDALTAELAKMKRVIQKRLSVENDSETGNPVPNLDVPHETLLVLDAAQGRMALDSARVWNQEIGLTGLILTKLDGSARGGSVVAISRDLQLPVKLIGVGEGIDDLRDFEPERFVDSLLGIGLGMSPSSGKSMIGGPAKQSAKNEGDVLAARLAELRKERDAASKVKKELAAVGAAATAPNTAASTPATMAPSIPNPASRQPGRRAKNNKKKKGTKK